MSCVTKLPITKISFVVYVFGDIHHMHGKRCVQTKPSKWPTAGACTHYLALQPGELATLTREREGGKEGGREGGREIPEMYVSTLIPNSPRL